MQPLFLGGHAAADFLNTRPLVRDEPVELLGDGAAFLRWLVDAGLLEAGRPAGLRRRFGVEALDEAAAQARALREWARAWLLRWRASPRADYARELRHLNSLLDGSGWSREAVAVEGGMRVVESCRLDAPRDLIALVAAEIAAFFAAEDPALVKRCAASDCNLWFVDRTKAHARMYCSAAVCGNRAKVAAFRRRLREAGD